MYGYKEHDWRNMRPEKQEKIIQDSKAYEAKKKELFKMGYQIFRATKAGTESTWTYMFNGKECGMGWDCEGSVVSYLAENVLKKVK